MILSSKHVFFGLNSFHRSCLTNYVNYSTVAQNLLYLFKIPLNDPFLKGTVEIKDFRSLAIHFHLKYFNCIFLFNSFFSCWIKK